ncbi:MULTISPECIES: transposase [Mesorhizobium]|uniref:transposase n=1 Tax=Rhizobium loti TaxID=381 RepID=UPI001140DD61
MSRKDRKTVVPTPSAIWRGADAKPGMKALEDSKQATRPAYPAITQSWRRDWQHVVPLRLSKCAQHHLHDGCG